jgi:predicted nucleic acid-binding Zn ribbon protein
MPTYEFRCPDGTIIERSFKISEVPDTVELPDGRVATRQISGGAGLLFKGTGFYITDYGKDGKKDQRATSSSGESGASKSDAKSDAKPAATPAPKAE